MLALGDCDNDTDEDGDTLALMDEEGLNDRLDELDGDTPGVSEGLALEEGLTLALGDSEALAELLGLREELGLIDAELLLEGLVEALGLIDALGLVDALIELEGDWLADGLMTS